jgi:phage recombination protein Bet
MTGTAIAIRDDQITFDDLQTRALAHLGVETANKADLAVFFHTCKRTGLDPFARQIYMIKRDGRQVMQTGIGGLQLIAQRTAERTHGTLGYEDTLWCGQDGQWRDVWLEQEPPAAAKVVVLRDGQRFPYVALFREYVQTYRDKQTGEQRPTKTWTEKAALMLAKCAEAGALRKAFPQDLSGIYSTDEIGHSETPKETVRPVAASDFTATPTDDSGTDAPEPPATTVEDRHSVETTTSAPESPGTPTVSIVRSES